jgi:hypothetical protein
MTYTYLTFIDSKVLLTSQTYILSNDLPVLDNYARESFDINWENARVFCSPGCYLRNTISLRKKEEMAMLRKILSRIMEIFEKCTLKSSEVLQSFGGTMTGE